MASRAERVRREIKDTDSPVGRHSLSAKKVRDMQQGEERLRGPHSGKIARIGARKSRFLTNSYRRKFEGSLGNVFNGNGKVTLEEITRLVNHISKLERPFNPPPGAEFDALPGGKITIVDFRKQF